MCLSNKFINQHDNTNNNDSHLVYLFKDSLNDKQPMCAV